jgi:hypothetical protein
VGETYWGLEGMGLILNLLPLPTTPNTFIFRHIIKDDAATECVDGVIRFSYRHAAENYAYSRLLLN